MYIYEVNIKATYRLASAKKTRPCSSSKATAVKLDKYLLPGTTVNVCPGDAEERSVSLTWDWYAISAKLAGTTNIRKKTNNYYKLIFIQEKVKYQI